MNTWNPFRSEALTGSQTVLAICLISVIAGISGWIYEELFYRINDGYFSRRGHGVGPWLPIYAFGIVILLFATAPVRGSGTGFSHGIDSIWMVFLLCAVISGAFEYLVGWVLFHHFHGLRLWDYNTERWNWGNIGGYVCFRSVLVFAAGSAFLIYTLVPMIGFLAKVLPGWAYTTISAGPFLLFTIDIIHGYLLQGF